MQRVEYQGKIKFLNNTADASTGTISLRAIVLNEKETLLPGQFVKLKIIIGEDKDAILIPKDAMQFGSDGQFVYVVSADNKAKRIEIDTSHSFEDYYVVSKGNVRPNDKIIVLGLNSIIDGTPIEVL